MTRSKSKTMGLKDIEELDQRGLQRMYRNALPAKYFEVSPTKSIAYFLFDLGLLSSSLFTWKPLLGLVKPILGQYLGSLVVYPIYCNFYGFIMACVYVVGHDCLHDVFLDSRALNHLYGLFCFTPLLIPFSSYQLMHLERHERINQLDPMNGQPYLDTLLWLESFYKKIPVVRPLLNVVFATAFYMYGMHMLPMANSSWSELEPLKYTRRAEKLRATSSMEDGLIFAFLLIIMAYQGPGGLALYFGSYAVFAWWMYCDFYMSRVEGKRVVKTNGEKAILVKLPRMFDKDIWQFGKGVMSVQDNHYGGLINTFRHQFTDTQCIHHLFYNQMPHYNLKLAKVHLQQKTNLYYNHTNYHKSAFADFFRVFAGIGYKVKALRLKSTGILVERKRHTKRKQSVYTPTEFRKMQEARWKRDVVRRIETPQKLAFEGGYVYPPNFDNETEQSKERREAQQSVMSRASLALVQSLGIGDPSGKRFVPLKGLINRQNGAPEDEENDGELVPIVKSL